MKHEIGTNEIEQVFFFFEHLLGLERRVGITKSRRIDSSLGPSVPGP
jgi:hypothetical protein